MIGVVLAASNAAAAPCVLGARVVGERDVTTAVELILRERGVAVVDAPGDTAPSFREEGCPFVVAEVWRGGGRIMVWVTDPDGRRVERQAEDPAAAATVIESWARRDLVSPLLAARATLPTGSGDVEGHREAPAASEQPRFGLLLGADAGLSVDGAIWTAARFQGCAMVGRMCLGGVIRYGFDLERTGDTTVYETHRRGLDLTVTAGIPFALAGFTIVPAVGIGQMAVTASRDVDPSDADMKKESEQSSAVHAMVACGAGVRLARAWSVRLDLAVVVAPFATRLLGEAGIDALPASAQIQSWIGLGLSYGGL